MKKFNTIILYVPSPKTRTLVGGVFAFALLALLLFLGWMRGPAQYGNIISLVGSLALVVPPVRQALRNAIFHFSLKDEISNFSEEVKQQTPEIVNAKNVESDKLTNLDPLIIDAKGRAFMMFSWLDVGFYAFGALLLACGFFISIVVAENK